MKRRLVATALIVVVTLSGCDSPPIGPPGRSNFPLFANRLHWASFAYSCPTELELGEVGEVEIAINEHLSVEELKKALSPGESEGKRIEVAEVMEATLTSDSDDLVVKSTTPSQQIIAGDATTVWQWKLQPTATGEKKLTITLSAIVQEKGADRARMLRTIEQPITVYVTAGNATKSFLATYWTWIVSVILLPVLIYVFRRHSDRKKQRNELATGLISEDRGDTEARIRALGDDAALVYFLRHKNSEIRTRICGVIAELPVVSRKVYLALRQIAVDDPESSVRQRAQFAVDQHINGTTLTVAEHAATIFDWAKLVYALILLGIPFVVFLLTLLWNLRIN